MLTFETVNELTLKVTCSGSDVLFTKAGAFVAGENMGGKNYTFDKVLFGPQQNVGQAILGSIVRRVTGENIPLMKVMYNGDSVTYFASYGRHVVIYKLGMGEVISVESENGNAKECSNYHTMALISHASKVMLKILQARLQQYVNRELPDVQAGFRKGRGTRDQIANIC